MKLPEGKVSVTRAVWGFSALVLAVAFAHRPDSPALAVSGEASVGTWLSGALLTAAATLALVAGSRRGAIWYLFAAFFALMALDERFMFHERMKEGLIFAFPAVRVSRPWLYEAPVLLGAGAGLAITLSLSRRLRGRGRTLLIGAASVGALSVILDVLRLGALPEDSLKLLAELLLIGALAARVEPAGPEGESQGSRRPS